MKVSLINIQHNQQNNKNSTFKGTVHKSVYRYLDYICPDTASAKAMKNEILEKLNVFMAPLHKDTTFFIKDLPAVRTYLLPFPEHVRNVAHELVYRGDYQTFFSNKKTKTLFSLSEHCTDIWDGKESYAPPRECGLDFPYDDKLSVFKAHVDAVIKFFNKDRGFDVDNVLYNKRLKNRPFIESFLPEFINKLRIKRDKKLAPEFQKFYSNKDADICNFVLP